MSGTAITSTVGLLDGVVRVLSEEADDLQHEGFDCAAQELVYLLADLLDAIDRLRGHL